VLQDGDLVADPLGLRQEVRARKDRAVYLLGEGERRLAAP